MADQPRPNGRNTLLCSSWPLSLNCRKLAKVAASLDRGFVVPFCSDCTENLRQADKLVESWGSASAVDFARRYHEAYPEVYLPNYKPG